MARPALPQTVISWDDLQSQSTHLSNPYEELSKAQTYRLSSLYQLKEWVKDNQPDSDSFEVKEIQRLEQSFIDEGIDAEGLLDRVGEAQDYWRSQSQITNPELQERSVQLSGYVLPLGVSAQNLNPETLNEFLLVPFVGACIHVPPPPPNQIIHIKTDAAIDNPGLFSYMQVTGTLRKQADSYELFQVDGSRIVDASYAMKMDAIIPDPYSNKATISGPWWQTLPARVSSALTLSLGNISEQKTPATFALAILLSFSYGVLHTLGPGHGKAVIVSYFVGHNGSLRRGMAMGVRIAVFHVLSAVLLAILTNTILQQFGGNNAETYRVIRLISYGAIALIGARMLKQALSRKPQTESVSNLSLELTGPGVASVDRLIYPSLSQQIAKNSNPPAFDAACNCLTCDEQKGLGGWLSLAVGSVPCSGALLVLLYGLANNLLWPSIMMVLAISVGMAITLGWIGAMAIVGNRYGQKFAARQQKRMQKTKRPWKPNVSLMFSGQILGACCVSLLGAGLFCFTLMTAW